MNSATVSNKQVIHSFYQAMNSRDIDTLLSFYAPSAVIEVIHSGKFSGKHRASDENLQLFFNTFPVIEFTIESMICENSKVNAQVTSQGEFVDGSAYSNRYDNRYELENGKITLFQERPLS